MDIRQFSDALYASERTAATKQFAIVEARLLVLEALLDRGEVHYDTIDLERQLFVLECEHLKEHTAHIPLDRMFNLDQHVDRVLGKIKNYKEKY